jgi:TetR/AcrR family transcriptional regulator of autoinduction and epiphytic fitness
MRAAAAALFAEGGYGRTTMEAIAEQAGVAVQTVYFTFHTKAELFAEVLKAGGGEPGDPIDVVQREWVAEMMAEPDPTRMLALLVDNGSDIFRRVAPLIEAMMTAAHEDEAVSAVVRDIFERRRAGQRRAMEALASKGGLREGVSVDHAADVLFVLQSAPTYQTFTAECGWSPERYKAWLFDTLTAALLPRRAATPAVIARATRGRSFHRERSAEERGK